MNSNFIYTVSRFSVSTEDEVLVEQAELICEHGILILRVDGTPDRHLAAKDLDSRGDHSSAARQLRAGGLAHSCPSDATYLLRTSRQRIVENYARQKTGYSRAASWLW